MIIEARNQEEMNTLHTAIVEYEYKLRRFCKVKRNEAGSTCCDEACDGTHCTVGRKLKYLNSLINLLGP